MTKLKFIIGIVFILLLIFLGFFMAGNSINLIIDILSFVVCIVAPYILISLVYSPKEQLQMTGEILSDRDSPNLVLLEKSVAYLKSLKSLVIVSGILWTLLGTVGILSHLEDPESIGANFSVALITIIYALIYILIIIDPLRASAEKKLKS